MKVSLCLGTVVLSAHATGVRSKDIYVWSRKWLGLGSLPSSAELEYAQAKSIWSTGQNNTNSKGG